MNLLNPSPLARAGRLVIAVALAALLGVGCDQSKTTNRSSDNLDENLGDREWAVAMDMLVGQGHDVYAQQRVRSLAGQTGMTEFWSVNEGTRSMVYFGRYDSPTDAQAQEDLAKLRQLAAAGRIEAGTINLTPVVEPLTGKADPHDLRAVRTPGAVYTLQVGFYDKNFGEGWREAAEQAVDAYREDGENAYFYHGPNRSLVTIGIFGRAAAKLETTGSRKGQVVYHPHIKDLQQKHPYNLANGVTLLVTDQRTGQKREQPSFLVKIPQ